MIPIGASLEVSKGLAPLSVGRSHIEALSQSVLGQVAQRTAGNDRLDLIRGIVQRKIERELQAYYENKNRNVFPTMVAKWAIDDRGELQCDVLQVILEDMKSLPPDANMKLSRLKFVLGQLVAFPNLRRQIETIRHPQEKHSPLEDMIRASLGYRADHQITDADARRVALAALITPHRQWEAGSCFATHMALELLNNRLDLCLRDFKEMFERGSLVRKVYKKPLEIPVNINVEQKPSIAMVTITSNGEIEDKNSQCKQWCDALGIDRSILEHIYRNHRFCFLSRNLTVSEEQLREHLLQYSPLGLPKEVALRRVAFASVTHSTNLLLLSWENTIANMAELSEEGYLKNKLTATLKATFPKMKHLFFEELRHRIHARIRYEFNPALVHHHLIDEHSWKGGFELVDTKGKIASPEAFKNFLLSILEEMKAGASAYKLQKVSSIQEVIKKHDFIEKYLHIYTSEDLKKREIYHTPWRDLTGNVSKAVLKLYFERESFCSLKIHAHSADNLLLSLLTVYREASSSTRKHFLFSRHTQVPSIIKGVHAFSLLPGMAVFSRGWSSKLQPRDWVNQQLIEPCKLLTHAEVSVHKAVEKCVHLFQVELSIKGPLPYKELRKQLIHAIVDATEKTPKEVSLKVDEILVNEIFHIEIGKRAIPFADTNWHIEGREKLFTFLYNPGSERVEVWTATAQGTHLNALDQDHWVHARDWKIFLEKEIAPSPRACL